MPRRRGTRSQDPPQQEEVRRLLIGHSPGHPSKQTIARSFSPEHRAAVRGLLRELAAEGALGHADARRLRDSTSLPETMVVQVTGTDADGDAIARPVGWRGERPVPTIFMIPEPQGRPALAPGERVLARLKQVGPRRYEARTMRRLGEGPARVLGVFEAGRILPTNRRERSEWIVPRGEEGGAQSGEIVVATPLPRHGMGLKPARVTERLGRIDDARAISLISIATHEIPHVFPQEALAEAAARVGVPNVRRTDLRHLPLVTIDGEDARDFDDAVYAERDGEGFRLIVAIADVAHYVRTGSALDRVARERGNSVYFPDRVVPMLPEALSNFWCSLRPEEDRACLFAELRINAAGRKVSHRFGRGVIRSAARLTYGAVERARAEGGNAGLPPGQLATLYAAYEALDSARRQRGALDLDLPEHEVDLDAVGRVTTINPRPRLASHRLIEEFMVLANVAAAEELERRHLPGVFRVHAPPSDEKLRALRDFLHGIDISLPTASQLGPRDLNGVLRRVAGSDAAPIVNQAMLRSQSQAEYSTVNIGHFGLALRAYAHFTSPIRRYADLTVHRALISGLGLGEGGLAGDGGMDLEECAAHVTQTERRATSAERDATDRYISAYLADKLGTVFAARISGVTRVGIFVTLDSIGASGIVPLSSLPIDDWTHDEGTATLTGRRTRLSFRLAQPVEVRVVEANPVTGGVVFRILTGDVAGTRRRLPRR
jgi:ribonuclease R